MSLFLHSFRKIQKIINKKHSKSKDHTQKIKFLEQCGGRARSYCTCYVVWGVRLKTKKMVSKGRRGTGGNCQFPNSPRPLSFKGSKSKKNNNIYEYTKAHLNEFPFRKKPLYPRVIPNFEKN